MHRIGVNYLRLLGLATTAGLLTVGNAHGQALELLVTETPSNSPLPCRIQLLDSQQKPVLPSQLPHWNDHFVCDGMARIQLAPGPYQYQISRGPEYEQILGNIVVSEAETNMALKVTLRRVVDLASQSWWSGETHLHRDPKDVPLLMQAEDLHIACANTWWNDGNSWASQPLPSETVIQFDHNRFYDQLSGEHERGGGALLFIGLKKPLPIVGTQHEYPSATKFLLVAKEQPNVWVDVEKPFWWDMPVWVATGMVDSIGIVHNHMQENGVMDNEAWGKPRDRSKYPGLHGNGLWTQDIYYQLLNTGVRIPPSAGSASGVLPNPVGYNRMYAQVDGDPTWSKWWDAVRRGRVFVCNGPLLRIRANGMWPGHVFKLPETGKLKLELTGKLDSRDPIKTIEIVHNGKIIKQISPSSSTQTEINSPVSVEDSGWFLVRTIADVPQTFRFASTGPFYVESASGETRASRQAAQFFLNWVRERMTNLKLDDPQEREEVLKYQRAAETFWQQKVSDATCD